MATGPIRVAIVNDYEIVVAGVAAMLAPYHDRVNVVELDSGLPVLSDVDVILYDTFGAGAGRRRRPGGPGARRRGPGRDLQLEHPGRAGAARPSTGGAAGYLSKGMSAEEIVAAIEAVHARRDRRPARTDGSVDRRADGRLARPGAAVSPPASPRCSR